LNIAAEHGTVLLIATSKSEKVEKKVQHDESPLVIRAVKEMALGLRTLVSLRVKKEEEEEEEKS
jgi:hypothetical protein